MVSNTGRDRPKWSFYSVVGQSYRLSREPTIFPNGTGLTDRFSDIVGGPVCWLPDRFHHALSHHKDNLALRRGEFDVKSVMTSHRPSGLFAFEPRHFHRHRGRGTRRCGWPVVAAPPLLVVFGSGARPHRQGRASAQPGRRVRPRAPSPGNYFEDECLGLA